MGFPGARGVMRGPVRGYRGGQRTFGTARRPAVPTGRDRRTRRSPTDRRWYEQAAQARGHTGEATVDLPGQLVFVAVRICTRRRRCATHAVGAVGRGRIVRLSTRRLLPSVILPAPAPEPRTPVPEPRTLATVCHVSSLNCGCLVACYGL
jgi:hypothetical protein